MTLPICSRPIFQPCGLFISMTYRPVSSFILLAYLWGAMTLEGTLTHSHDLEGEHAHAVTFFNDIDAEHESGHRHGHDGEYKNHHDVNEHNIGSGLLEHHHHGRTDVLRLGEMEYTYRRASFSKLAKELSQRLSFLHQEDWRRTRLLLPLLERDHFSQIAVGQLTNTPLLI